MSDRTENDTLKICFTNQEALEHFALWLCEEGEQLYWEWMNYREAEEAGPITVTEFNYHTPTEDGSSSRATFIADRTIRATCGRLDEED